MFYNEELIFIEMFMYAICSKGIREIPFSNDKFNNGISAIDKYLRESIDEDKYDLIMNLFIKNPIYNEYDKIIKGIMETNGRLCSFPIKNPVWETLILNSCSQNTATKMLDLYTDTVFPKEIICNVADKFIESINYDVA